MKHLVTLSWFEVTDAHSHTNISSPSAHVAESVSMSCEWTEGGS